MNFYYFDENCNCQIAKPEDIENLLPLQMNVQLRNDKIMGLFIKNNPWIVRHGSLYYKHCVFCSESRNVNLIRPGDGQGTCVCRQVTCWRKCMELSDRDLIPDHYLSFILYNKIDALPQLEYTNTQSE